MQRLPEDILLQICEWLSVRDILALRRLSRFFYSFTKVPNIWLSLLRRLRLLLPPCQPVVIDAQNHRTIEYYLSRSMRFQQNWRCNNNPYPKYYTFSSHHKVIAMVFLPGGNHMVSVHEGIDNTQNLIIVWDMSSLGKRNHTAIAMIRSRTLVKKLQARYALVGGHVSLVIAYVRPFDERRTAIVAMFAHLALLNEMSRLGPGTPAYEEFMKRSTEPFENLLEASTRYSIGAISLSEIDGLPILGVVYRPRTVAVYNLVKKTRFLLKLQASKDFIGLRHSIWHMKILPTQKQILIVRVLIDTEFDFYGSNPIVFELYSIVHQNGHSPSHDEELHTTPVQRRVILNENIEGCYISDGDNSWNFHIHPDPDTFMLHTFTRAPPPPLSIFIVTKKKRGFIQFVSNPVKRAGGDFEYYYDLPVVSQARYDWEEQETPMILPGGYHSIVIMRPDLIHPPDGDSILQLCTYCTESYEFSGPGETGTCSPEQKPESNGMQIDAGFTKTSIGRNMKYPALPNDLALSMQRGTRCLQFDEWLGRLFVVTSNNPCSIHVLDWSL